MNAPDRKHLLIFSEPNFLAVRIVKDLLAQDAEVSIVTSNKKGWLLLAGQEVSSLVNFISFRVYNKYSGYTAAIFIGGFLTKKNIFKDFKKFTINRNLHGVKTIAVFPYELAYLIQNKIKINKNASVVYIGDLFGAGLDLNSDLRIPVLVKSMIDKRVLTMSVGELFYPVDVSEVSSIVVHDIFSSVFGGKEIYILGKVVGSTSFWKHIITRPVFNF